MVVAGVFALSRSAVSALGGGSDGTGGISLEAPSRVWVDWALDAADVLLGRLWRVSRRPNLEAAAAVALWPRLDGMPSERSALTGAAAAGCSVALSALLSLRPNGHSAMPSGERAVIEQLVCSAGRSPPATAAKKRRQVEGASIAHGRHPLYLVWRRGAGGLAGQGDERVAG